MFEQTKEKFLEFIKANFDLNDPKISHKLSHTFFVVNNAEYICLKKDLNSETIELAKLIALFHDFGRFYEAREYKSFREDLIKMDHASIGTKVLFEEGLIRHFVSDSKYDKTMKLAISHHNKYKLDITGLTDEEILHSKIIRDADKIDSFRNKAITDIFIMSNITKEELENSLISDKIYNDFMQEKAILDTERKTALDVWVSYIAFIFDIYFPVSLNYIKEKNYINILVDKYNYQLPEAKKQMENIRNKANSFLENNITKKEND